MMRSNFNMNLGSLMQGTRASGIGGTLSRWFSSPFLKTIRKKHQKRRQNERARLANVGEQLETRALLAGLVVVPTYDVSITSKGNAAQIQAAIQRACDSYTDLFTNPVTVSILFKDISTGLGFSNTPRISTTWNVFLPALAAHATTLADVKALKLLPAGPNNPVTNTPGMVLTRPNARALGLTDTGSGFDATISLNTSKCSFDRSAIGSSQFDLQTVALHEIDEVLGTSSGLFVGQPVGFKFTPQSTDLFRYDSAGNRSFTNDTSIQPFFSPFGGKGAVQAYNHDDSGDYGDWLNSPVFHRVQDAIGTRGAFADLAFEERLLLDVIGWDDKQTDLAPTDISLGKGSITEAARAGTLVGGFRTTDVGTSQVFTYELVSGPGSDDNASFSLDPGGALRTAAVFDFEAKSSRTIRVRSTDPSGASIEKAITVPVNNIQDTPVFVDSLQDTDFNDNFSSGQMTLRKALRICNSQPGADVIQFRQGLFNGDTIVLNGTSLPAITDDVQIIGPGANLLSISGNDLSRILQVDASVGHTDPPGPGTVNVTVSGLTFTHGKTPDGDFDPAHNGAAIENRQGNLTLRNVVIRDSHAGRDGGAVANFLGTLVVDGSSLINNSAARIGGAIMNEDFGDNQSRLIVTNTTITGNRSDSFGGGIMVLTGSAQIVNSTIVGNHSNNDNQNRSSGIPENGGGIAISGRAPSVFLGSSIVAGNFIGSADTVPSDVNGQASNLPPFFTVSQLDPNSSFNFIGDSGSAGGLQNGVNNNRVGNAGAGTLVLSTLLDVGTLETNKSGTLDFPLVTGSPAIDAGSSFQVNGTTLATDQRGFSRNVDGNNDGIAAVDVGAFESQPPPLISNAGSGVNYAGNAAPVLLLPQAFLSLAPTSSMAGGSLKVSSSNTSPLDRIAIQSDVAGLFLVSGTNILLNGVRLIASFTGGDGANPLVISFAGDSIGKTFVTPVAVQQILRNLTFASTGNSVSVGTRTLTFTLSDNSGAVGTGPVLGVTVIVDTTPPTTAVTTAAPTINVATGGARTTSVTLTFADAGSGVKTSTFGTSNITVNNGATVTGFSANGNAVTYTITAAGARWNASTQGTYTIGLTGTVTDLAGNAIVARSSLTTFLVDTVAPKVVSLNRTTPASSPTNAASFKYTVTLSETVTGVDPSDFASVVTGRALANSTGVVTGSGSTYTLAVDGNSGNGTVGLNLVNNGSIRDLAGNPLVTTIAPGIFTSAQNFATGATPFAVALADVNGDSRVDMLTANFSSNSVSVLLGNGNGTFKPAQNFAAGNRPYSIAVADTNGDGRADLALANFGDQTVSVLLGNGNGTFKAAQNFTAGPTGSKPTSVVLADMNGDGRLDLAVSNYKSNTASVLLGNGDGTFKAAQNFATARGPNSVAAADINGDGRLDLVTAGFGASQVSVLLGNGNGTFAAAKNFGTGVTPIFATIADVNGDRKPDLAVANKNSNTVSVLLGNANGTFAAAKNFSTGKQPAYVAVGDENGDGRPDLAVANYAAKTLSVLLGNGNGTFGAAQNLAVGNGPNSIAAGDVNGDGRPDLAVANYLGNSASVLLGTGNGTFTGQVTTIDQTVPIATLTLPAPAINASAGSTNTTTIRVSYADATAGVNPSTFGTLNIAVNNGAVVTGFSATGNVVTYTIKSQGADWAHSFQGTYTVKMLSTVTDLAGNHVAVSSNFSTFQVDTTRPGGVWTQVPSPTRTAVSQARISWTEAVQNIKLNDFTLNGRKLSTLAGVSILESSASSILIGGLAPHNAPGNSDQTFTLGIVSDTTLQDLAGNPYLRAAPLTWVVQAKGSINPPLDVNNANVQVHNGRFQLVRADAPGQVIGSLPSSGPLTVHGNPGVSNTLLITGSAASRPAGSSITFHGGAGGENTLLLDVTGSTISQAPSDLSAISGQWKLSAPLVVNYTNVQHMVPLQRMYRVYNPHADQHLFTSSTGEFHAVIRNGLQDETSGQSGWAVSPRQLPGGSEIFRLYNPTSGGHYLTLSPGERDALVGVGWKFERGDGFMFSTQVPGSTVIYRLYNQFSGEHLYTESPSYKDAMLAKFDGVWRLTDNLGYAFPVGEDEVPSALANTARQSPSVQAERATDSALSLPAATSRDETLVSPASASGVAPSVSAAPQGQMLPTGGNMQSASPIINRIVSTTPAASTLDSTANSPTSATPSAAALLDGYWTALSDEIKSSPASLPDWS